MSHKVVAVAMLMAFGASACSEEPRYTSAEECLEKYPSIDPQRLADGCGVSVDQARARIAGVNEAVPARAVVDGATEEPPAEPPPG